MSVAFAGVPIYEATDDLCAKAACPLAKGPIEIVYRQDLPPVAPPVRRGMGEGEKGEGREAVRGYAGVLMRKGWGSAGGSYSSSTTKQTTRTNTSQNHTPYHTAAATK